MNVRLHIAYDGTDFHGWQRQRDVATVEGEIRGALCRILDIDEEALDFQGASRTDAGVHALGQVASFHHQSDRSLWDFWRGINALTPDSICVTRVEEASSDFNARHDSGGKHYRYRIWNHRFPHPLERDRSWCFPHELDAARMQVGGEKLLGSRDFSAFRAANCQADTTIRKITRVDVSRDGAMVTVDVEGTAFLKYMVRIIVGTLVDVGVGRRAPEWVASVLESGQRIEAGVTAPPGGLTLMEVFYPQHPWSRPPALGLRQNY